MSPPALSRHTVEQLREALPEVAERTVSAITDDVPSYADALTGPMGRRSATAVELALGGFISLAARSQGAAAQTPTAPAVDGAYQLGRGEARSGRTVDALLSAYRIGARVSWREMSSTAVRTGVEAATLAQFAELVFAYIDQLSAASVAGHNDELATTGRVRQRLLERLADHLLDGSAARRSSARRAGRVDAAGDADRRARAGVAGARRARRGLGGDAAVHRGAARRREGGRGCCSCPTSTAGPAAAAAVAGRPGRWRGRRGRGRRCATSSTARSGCASSGWGAARPGRQRGAPGRAGAHRRPERVRRPARPGARPARRPARLQRGEADRDAAVLAAAPRPPRRGRGRPVRARPDRPLPDGSAARGLRRPPRGPPQHPRADGRPGPGGQTSESGQEPQSKE